MINGIGAGCVFPTINNLRAAGTPALSLDFLNPSLDSRITFSRASGGTRVNSAGLIETVPVNLITQSQDLSNAQWTKTDGDGTTVTADATTAPDGTLTADKFVVSAGTAASNTVNNKNCSVTTGLTYTGSVYLKQAEYGYAFVVMIVGFATCGVTINLATGAVSDAGTGSAVEGMASSSAGNGWWRVSLTKTSNATTAVSQFAVYMSADGVWANRSTAKTVGSGLYMWGAQLQTGSVATTYIPTTTTLSGAPRFDYDPVTLAPRGLLIEESRANLLTASNSATATSGGSVVQNAASPDGTTNGWTFTEGATNQQICAFSTGTATAAVHTVSAYVKAGTATRCQLSTAAGLSLLYCNFSLVGSGSVLNGGAGGTTTPAIAPAGNGWFRISWSGTLSAGSGAVFVCGIDSDSAGRAPSYASSGLTFGAYGAQFELGAFPTSYIPTTTAAVTRAADVASMTGTNFSSWFNATEGTFVASADVYARTAGVYPQICSVSDGTSNNVIWMYFSATSQISTNIVTGSVNQGILAVSNTGTTTKTALGYKLNDHRTATFGVLSALDDVCALPVVDRMSIGWITGGNALNGHLQRITYYNKRLPDATLKALSA